MTVKNKKVIKFTRDDIESVYLFAHKYDVWASITLKTGVEIRSHSLELEKLQKVLSDTFESSAKLKKFEIKLRIS